ncbi:MAG TPA: choice-of-anchor Q domain-containing protein [Rudaea sp.]|nr:choice-of-anchor Q domain-containing protein [Rudaea sp.]
MRRMTQGRAPRLVPLVAALAAIVSGESFAESAGTPFSVAAPAGWHPGDGHGVAALMQALRVTGNKLHRPSAGPASTHQVTSCADDGSPGTLRDAIAAANSGDTIDLGALSCSTITLAQGAIPIVVDDLVVKGSGGAPAIDGAGQDRVFIDYGYGTLTLQSLVVRNGRNYVQGFKVAGGACVLANGYVTLVDSTVSGCTSIGEGAYGGGILATGITLYKSTLSGNTAQGAPLKTLTASYGAGAFAYRGTAALYDSTVSGNRAAPDAGNTYGSYDTGGGIFSDNGGLAYRSTIDHNYSSGTGGGIASHYAFFVIDSTVSTNAARKKAGGGIFVLTYGGLTIENSTIAFNEAPVGAGVYVAGTLRGFTLQSTLIVDNTGGADIAARHPPSVTGANNLVGTAGAGIALPADTRHGPPVLLPLTNNGGPVRTHALGPGSAAIDAGNNAAGLVTDQRGPGFPRVRGAAPDIGAFESVAAPVAVLPVPLADWCTRLLVAILCALGLQRLRKQT